MKFVSAFGQDSGGSWLLALFDTMEFAGRQSKPEDRKVEIVLQSEDIRLVQPCIQTLGRV
jgi:hypothetical protein